MSESPLQFRLQITCDNAAFQDSGITHEIARCLRDVAARLERGDTCDTYRDIRDANGNTVGHFALKPRAYF